MSTANHNPDDDRGYIVKNLCVFMITSSVVVVCLRFASRKLSNAGYWWDDWLILMALPFALGINAQILAGARFYSHNM